MDDNEFLSVAEVAKILSLSRVGVHKKIKSGEIRATRVGRSFVIAKKDILEIAGHLLGEERKKTIEKSVDKTLKEYGEAIRKLGEE